MCEQQRLRLACAYAQSDQSHCLSVEYSMTGKLLTEHHLKFLSLKGGCTGSSESTLVEIPHGWKSHAAAHFAFPLLPHCSFLLNPFLAIPDNHRLFAHLIIYFTAYNANNMDPNQTGAVWSGYIVFAFMIKSSLGLKYSLSIYRAFIIT